MPRALDLAILIIIAPIAIPTMAIVYMMAAITHGTPVFFSQTRIGMNECYFTLYKFRTMVVGAQLIGTKLNCFKGDPRVTRFGKLLRLASLDELPQLYNVLRGDMSLVGPRPAVKGELETEGLEKKEYSHRFNLRPGLTGWAQIHGRDHLTWREKLKYDREFVEMNPIKRLFISAYIIIFTPIYLLNFSATYEKPKDKRALS